MQHILNALQKKNSIIDTLKKSVIFFPLVGGPEVNESISIE